MNSNILLGKWRQIRGYFKQTIGKFSGDYLLQAGGIGDRMQGAKQEHSGYTQENNPPSLATQDDRKATLNEVLLNSGSILQTQII